MVMGELKFRVMVRDAQGEAETMMWRGLKRGTRGDIVRDGDILRELNTSCIPVSSMHVYAGRTLCKNFALPTRGAGHRYGKGRDVDGGALNNRSASC